MNTFLPYPDFDHSARCLDRQRLGKQRVETLQLLNVLTGVKKGWANHPATKMWRGRTNALVVYGLTMCREWKRRGYRDTCEEKILQTVGGRLNLAFDYPKWFGDEAFHAAHRSNLLRKNPDWYRQFGWSEPDNLPYVWPV